MSTLAGLPRIVCDRFAFDSVEKWNNVTYYITSIKRDESQMMVHSPGWKKDVTIHSNSKFPIDRQLEVLNKLARRQILSYLASVSSFVVALVVGGVKRSVTMGAVGMGIALFLFFVARAYRKQYQSCSFDIANRIISTYQNANELTYNPADYGL